MSDASLDPADAALVGALSAPSGDGLVTLEGLAERAGAPLPLVEAIAREGLLVARAHDADGPRFDPADAEAVRAGLTLVEAGLPLAELLDLARRTDEALRPVARHAVDGFLRYVRDPALGSGASQEEVATVLLDAFHTMLPATKRLVGHHVGSLLVLAAQERLATELAEGDAAGDEPQR